MMIFILAAFIAATTPIFAQKDVASPTPVPAPYSQHSLTEPCETFDYKALFQLPKSARCKLSPDIDLVRTEISHAGLTLKGWIIDSKKAPEDFKHYVWLDFGPELRGRSVASFQSYCRRHLSDLPNIEQLNHFAELSGFLTIKKSIYMKAAIAENHFNKVHILSKTKAEDNKNISLNLANPKGEQIQIDPSRGALDKNAVDASVCVLDKRYLPKPNSK